VLVVAADEHLSLAVFKSLTSLQEVPLYNSVSAEEFGPGVIAPPNAIAAVCDPPPPKTYLAVFKAPPVDQAPADVTA